jgi:RecJ-like exonuclease
MIQERRKFSDRKFKENKFTEFEPPLSLKGKVENLFQTSGPTIFQVFDGDQLVELAGFSGAGVRAYPEINPGDFVKISYLVLEHNGRKRPEITAMVKIEGEEKDEIEKTLTEKFNQKIAPVNTEFLIKSQTLEKMKPRFIEAAKRIREAIFTGRSIIIRHHADTDGFVAGVALERSILPLIKSEEEWKYYRRSVSRTPFYSIEDAIRDITYYVERKQKGEARTPLLILLDNGSTEEDVVGIRKARIYGFDIIVLDHHNPGEANVDEYVDVHINPHLFGSDRNLTAGMISTELARFVNPVENISFFPALAGAGDYARGQEMDQYMEISKKQDLNLEELRKISLCIDYEAYYLGYIEGKGLIDDLLRGDMERHKNMIELLYSEIQSRLKTALEIVDKYKKQENLNGMNLVQLDLENSIMRREYPNIGKVTGLLFEKYLKEDPNTVVLGVTDDLCVIRASETCGFSLQDFMKRITGKILGFSGGGHENAGTIKYIKAVRAQILKELRDYVSELGKDGVK